LRYKEATEDFLDMLIGGLDEVGYGALAGPYISAVAVFDETALALIPPGVTDSKKLDDDRRRRLYLPLCSAAVDVGIGHAWPWEIDTLGAQPALQLSYKRALEELHVKIDTLIVDGSNPVRAFKSNRQVVQPKADFKYKEVGAASIIAKHFRDEIMRSYAKIWPQYNWEVNKGYGTKDHEDAIHKYGLLIDDNNHSLYLHRRLYTRKILLRRP
jgi:ribonuclease HII